MIMCYEHFTMVTLLRSAAVLLALATPGLVLPAQAQQIAEPIPQRRDAISRPMRPQPQRDAMLPCPEYGPGFFRQPGVSTCVRIGGQLRGEFGVQGRRSRFNDTTGSSAQARVTLDTRTPTDLGTVRAVMSLRGQTNSGFLTNGTGTSR